MDVRAAKAKATANRECFDIFDLQNKLGYLESNSAILGNSDRSLLLVIVEPRIRLRFKLSSIVCCDRELMKTLTLIAGCFALLTADMAYFDGEGIRSLASMIGLT